MFESYLDPIVLGHHLNEPPGSRHLLCLLDPQLASDLPSCLLLSLRLLLHLLQAGAHIVGELLDLGHQVIHVGLLLLVNHRAVQDLTLQLLYLLNLGVDLLTVVPDVLDLLEELFEGALLVPHPNLEIISLFNVGILLHRSQPVLWRRHLDVDRFLTRSFSSGSLFSSHMDLCRPRSSQLPVKLNVQRQI